MADYAKCSVSHASDAMGWSADCDVAITGLKVMKLKFILRLIIKCNYWLLVDKCPRATNYCALF